MKNHFLDAIKGIAKLVGMVFYIIGWPFYKFGYWLLNMRSSRDKMLEQAIKQTENKIVKKKTPRKATPKKEGTTSSNV